MAETFKHLLQCADCDEPYYVLTRREDQPAFCPLCGGSDVLDATQAPATPADGEEEE